jgi:hypothetical protein
MGKHLSRQELIEVARGRTSRHDRHLRSCRQCREAVDLMRLFDFSGHPRLEDAPSSWIKKAASIAENRGVAAKARSMIAKLTFDSWDVPQPVGVREQGSIGDRRVRFLAENIVLDFRAERQRTGWAFVAQVTYEKEPAGTAVVEVGRKKVHPDATGLFQWTSRRPLADLTVRCGDLCITLPELSWKNPQQN